MGTIAHYLRITENAFVNKIIRLNKEAIDNCEKILRTIQLE